MNRTLRLKALRNLLKMGHCAPTVMRTLLEHQGIKDKRMIRLIAGLPGGIGNLGSECGGVTSAVMILGLHYGGDAHDGGIPRIIPLGKKYMNRFGDAFGSINCKEINRTGSDMLSCARVICKSPGLFLNLVDEKAAGALHGMESDTADAYARLLEAFRAADFHCAHTVLHRLEDVIHVDAKLSRVSWGFLGGTLLQGLTCSALTAGVLAIGSRFGEIENSYFRVTKWIVQGIMGADGMRDDANKFNRAINVGNELALWFKEEFSSTNCRDICRADLTTPEGIDAYLASHGIAQCRTIADQVALRTRAILSHHALVEQRERGDKC